MDLAALNESLLNTGLSLSEQEEGLTLCSEDGSYIRGDFTHMAGRLKRNNLTGELLVKAARIKGKTENLTVVDATAGLGEDSLLLSASGFEVYLYEKDPVIAALLEDAMNRASLGEDETLKEAVLRMHLKKEDSITAMRSLSFRPDVIYLDPMFPERKKSSLVKKKFQLIHGIEDPCRDEEELLEAAILAGPSKIIIKRPLKGPFLSGKKPSYSLTGKTVRMDIIVLNT